MTEGLANILGQPTAELQRLYGIWSDGGAGLQISGNIHIDADHLERPGNVFIHDRPDEDMMAALRAWTKAGTRAGNHFWAQISHAGRQTMRSVNPHPKAPSAVKLGLPGGQFGIPVALTEDEILNLIGRFGQAALHCKNGGFTGVQIHAAHGYLISQFLSPRSNQRNDRWGGSLENRARLLLEVTDAAIEVWGAGRVGVHLAPRADSHDMGDANRTETFSYVARELGARGIAFICAREKAADDSLSPMLKQAFGGVFIANERFTKEQANAWIAEGKADAVAFGIPFIANPDLPARLAQDAELNTPHPETFYSQGPVGYLDYPTL